MRELEGIQDPLVVSIFKQCAQHVYLEQEGTLVLTFSQDLLFFKDWLGKTETIWKPIIEKFYGAGTQLQPNFDGVSTKQRPVVVGPIKPMQSMTAPVQQRASANSQASAPQAPRSAPKSSVPAGAPSQGAPQRPFLARPAQKTAPQEPGGTAVSPEGLKTGSLVAQAFPGRLLVHESTSKESI